MKRKTKQEAVDLAYESGIDHGKELMMRKLLELGYLDPRMVAWILVSEVDEVHKIRNWTSDDLYEKFSTD